MVSLPFPDIICHCGISLPSKVNFGSIIEPSLSSAQEQTTSSQIINLLSLIFTVFHSYSVTGI
jgi:hypothetical protein